MPKSHRPFVTKREIAMFKLGYELSSLYERGMTSQDDAKVALLRRLDDMTGGGWLAPEDRHVMKHEKLLLEAALINLADSWDQEDMNFNLAFQQLAQAFGLFGYKVATPIKEGETSFWQEVRPEPQVESAAPIKELEKWENIPFDFSFLKK